ncbi:hypothetical protein KFV02_10835 [Desulfohalobiaceae bacterium Ax17]|uniref:outer membrane lipoprotein-sorting protein n=1 Tax=Desulfovulcanus ferrireducens TaxID=2831190 RepID=UPI00207B9F8B|nr:outer membrane lipoprotein-sorting protein [Desulfovulcanus ferrireducens]MBT8764429.1 hypothetical protein [Desulfovulcanus ferrireducens]
MRSKIIFLFLLAIFSSVELAWGFFPDIEEVNARWLKNLNSLNAFQVVCTYDLEEKLSVRLWQKGNLWREEWTIQVKGQNKVVWAGLGRGQEVILAYPELKLKPRPVLNFWRKDLNWWIIRGLDTNLLSYQFLQYTPCLVLGGESLQIWLDNNLMLPVRLVFGDGGDNFDFNWSKYHQIGNFWLPKKMSIVHQTQNWECTFEWRGINIDLPDELFSPQGFQNRFERLNNSSIPSEILTLMKVLARAHETINIEHATANP